jgi:hypothetical protein
MSRDLYLEKYVKLLEGTATRAHKDLERERRRVDFLDGKVERLELVVMAAKNDAGREFVERSDRATAPPQKKPAMTEVRINPEPSFKEIREKWNSMSLEEQEKALEKADLVVEEKSA